MRHLKQQRGVALITVMMVVALAAIIATKMTSNLQLQIQRVSNIQSNQQAYWYAMSAEALARSVLMQDIKKDKNVTHLEQMWAQGETVFPVENGQISGEISDLHACLNLNNLRPPPGTQRSSDPKKDRIAARIAFEELLLAISLDGVDQFQIEYMADALTDWLDDNSSIVSAGGAEDNDYSSKLSPYLPANSYIASINELRTIEHFTLPVIEKLKEYTCVIPNKGDTKINVNTISTEQPELLQGLLGGITKEEAETILSARPEKGWQDVNDFLNLKEVKAVKDYDKFKDQFAIKSEYFKLASQTSYNNSYFSLTSILKITDADQVVIINRAIGAQ